MTVKVAFIEDNQVFSVALKIILLEEKKIDLIGMFSTAEAFLSENLPANPDVMILDVDLPGMSGLEAIAFIKARHPVIKIIVFTIHEDEEKMNASLKAGANLHLLKKNSLENLNEIILSLFSI